MQDKIIRKRGIDISIRPEDIQGYLELIKSWGNWKKAMGKKGEKELEITELYCVYWGLLHLSTTVGARENTTASNYAHKINACVHALTGTVANGILAITKLACSGLDFQSGVIFRSLFETSFILLTIMIDKEKCEAYFNSANKDNERVVWNKHFRMGKLNAALREFEKEISPDGGLGFLSKWREKNYRFYSEYAHSSFFWCYTNNFGHADFDNENKIMPSILWGENATRIFKTLNHLNELMFYVSMVFSKIIGRGAILKEQIVGEEQRKIWNDAGIIHLITHELYLDNKLHTE